MPTPVLATKLFVPALRPQVVFRPRLIERLREGLRPGRKLTLISAPAGFGKTTLLGEWIVDSQRRDATARVAWLSLDDGDSDPTRFLTYLVAALQSAVPGAGSVTVGSAAAPAGQPSSVEQTLTALLNEVAQAPHQTVLVLDDFHLIGGAPVQAAVTFLLGHLPMNLHLAIAGRSDPPLPLARLRARAELTELRAADLRFTPEESAAFLNQVMGLRLSADDIAALDTRTEGWIAGLQLAALSMRDRSDIAGFIRAFTGSHRFVIDYLVEEVLQRQPDDVRGFLFQTAVLDRLSGPLCDAVTGQASGTEMLAALERDNLFITPLDDDRRWYRYHHLFADVLRARFPAEWRDRLPDLHRRASEWHERNGPPEDAVRHALAASDFDRAADLIEGAVPALRKGRQDATLLEWLTQLPAEVVARRPVLSVYLAWSMLISGDLDAVELRLRNAEEGLRAAADASSVPDASVTDPVAVGEELRMLPVMIAVYRASLAQALGDMVGTAEHAQRALDLTEPGDHFGRAAAAGFLGLASWANGDLEAGLRAFAEVRDSLRLAGNAADVLGTTVVLADMLIPLGRLRDARRAYEDALQLASAQGDPAPQPMGDLHVGLSELHRERNELDAATEHLLAARTLGERASLPENRYRWFVAMARVREAEGEPDAALDLLTEAELLYARGFFPEVRPIAAMRARVWISQGRLAEAREWANGQGLSAAEDVTYLHEFAQITLARLLIAEHRADPKRGAIREALGLLDRLLQSAEAGRRTGSVNEVLVLQALAHQAYGQLPLALLPLERVLGQAEPEGYLRLFADEGAPLAGLLREAAQRGILPNQVSRLRRAFRPGNGGTATPQPAAEALSERELHVLRLLATELSGPEIARELYLSLNTVRTHTRHIFGKLSVNSRPAAVRRADELGLLQRRSRDKDSDRQE
ncbi:LuxR C-terminal-related transcriptional regulator [Cryobacterium fucosi]|uniref:Helix-turn-helix transcriptional regulator n=1 Tax=Cryobacterium fucosi TaxID=1259157 RepID=A0A4R9BCD0_9MICO|nr:LuxR C-terminal-related transcriptional regulator [Cryobacterium fucosi]TFD79150.1 helix-turn-helix transcriptional regulator [Cryobacterium fucosi]